MAQNGEPGVSVVVPTYHSETYLARLLPTLDEAFAEAPCPCEIVIVDTSPLDGESAERTKALCEQHDARFLHGPWRSVARSRNVGIDAARYDKVFFTDSDCRVTPEAIAEHLKVLSNGDGRLAATIGVTHLDGKLGPAGRAILATHLAQFFGWAGFLQEDLPWGATANLMIHKAALQEVGGFDETVYSLVGGEDVDLCWRVTDTGKALAAAPKAVVLHASEPWDTWRANLRRVWNYGVGEHFLLRKHPHRAYWDPMRSPLFLLLVVAVGMVMGLLGGPWCGVAAGATAFALGVGIETFATNWALNHYFPKGRRDRLLDSFAGQLYMVVYDTAYALSAVRRGHPLDAFWYPLHFPKQKHAGWSRALAKGAGLALGAAVGWATLGK
jgi:GT2 family glycosyltransferase